MRPAGLQDPRQVRELDPRNRGAQVVFVELEVVRDRDVHGGQVEPRSDVGLEEPHEPPALFQPDRIPAFKPILGTRGRIREATRFAAMDQDWALRVADS